MNNIILQQYGLKFNIIIDKDNNREARVSGGSQSVYLDDYLMTGNYKEFYSDELLPEIENAIQGNNFDPDGGGDNTFLIIDYPQSFLKRINGIDPQLSIPTEDLKEIIESWIEFLTINGLEK